MADANSYDPLMDSPGQADFTLDPIILEGKERWKLCQEWESYARDLWLKDLKFAEADSDNHYQWPDSIRRNRDTDQRPTLTINKTRQHNLQIINDAKQNKPGIKYSATGNGATYESAKVMNGIARHIEYKSNAQFAYDLATEFQVKSGIGYWRVHIDYVGPDTFDQDIWILPCADPLNVYLDRDIKQRDGSDAKYGFVFDDVPKDKFNTKYPQYKFEEAPQAALGNDDDWVTRDHIRVAEYYRLVPKQDTLYTWIDKEGKRQYGRASVMGKELEEEVKALPNKSRPVVDYQLEWYFIVGDEIKDRRTDLPGKFIPIVRVVGEEVLIEGVVDRKGHTRALKDPQRMYNYHSSASVEYAALQTKTPWTVSVEAIEGYETYWSTANNVNTAYLPYNALADDGVTKLDAPQRVAPPQFSPAYIQAMQSASQEMMMVSGQYQAMMGQASNERSGKAINERQRQGENSTYHFIDNLALAISFTGRIIMDLIPKVYDTQRVIQILAEDGKTQEIQIDPTAQQVWQQVQQQNNQSARQIFNPTVGEYWVQADVGPSYGTRRQQAFDAILEIVRENPGLTSVVGDLLMRNADFPDADEIAERLHRMVPPQALGTGPSQAEQQLQQQIMMLQTQLGQTEAKLTEAKLHVKAREEQKDIDVYDAETKRLAVLAKLAPDADPHGIQEVMKELVQEALRTHLSPLLGINAPDIAGDGAAQTQPQQNQPPSQVEPPPIPGARKAPDGQWYVNDPTRPGKFARVRSAAA